MRMGAGFGMPGGATVRWQVEACGSGGRGADSTWRFMGSYK